MEKQWSELNNYIQADSQEAVRTIVCGRLAKSDLKDPQLCSRGGPAVLHVPRSSQYCNHHTTQYVRLFLPEYSTVYDTSIEVVSPRREKSRISKIS